MSKFTRREFLLSTGLLGIGALLAACAPKATPTPEAPKAPTQPPAAVQPTAVPATPPPKPAAEKIKVEWMNWWGGAREELMNEVIRRFEAEFPDIHVENQVQPWDAREQRAATAIASGTPPGLIMVTRTEAQKFAYEKLIIPIDDYISARGHDVYDIFLRSEIDAMKFEGKFWSYPLPGNFLDSTFALYNKNLMRESELDPDAPPKVWSDVETAMDAMTTFSGDLLETIGAHGFTGRFPMWIYCNNGKYYSDDARQLLFNSAEGVETLEYIVGLLKKAGGIESYNAFMEGLDPQKADYPFYTDTLGMFFPNVSIFGHFRNTAPDMYQDTDRWGVILIPYNGKNPNAKPTGISGLIFTWHQVIPAAHPPALRDAAYEFLEFFTMREEGGGYFLLQQGRPSPVRRFNENPEYYKMNPYWEELRKIMEYDIGVPTTPVQLQVADILNKNLEQVWFEEKQPKQALDDAYDEAQPVVDAFWGKS